MTSTDFLSPGTNWRQGANNPIRFLSRFFVVFSATLLIVLGSGCASASKKKTPPPPNPVANKLPKPAPMRVAADTSNRRNAPALPKIVDLTPKKETDTAATDLVPLLKKRPSHPPFPNSSTTSSLRIFSKARVMCRWAKPFSARSSIPFSVRPIPRTSR